MYLSMQYCFFSIFYPYFDLVLVLTVFFVCCTGINFKLTTIFTVSENKKKVSKYIKNFFYILWKSRIFFSKIHISPLTQDNQIKKSIFNKYERRWNIIKSLKYYNKIQAPSSERTHTCQTCVSGVYTLTVQVSILIIWIYLIFYVIMTYSFIFKCERVLNHICECYYTIVHQFNPINLFSSTDKFVNINLMLISHKIILLNQKKCFWLKKREKTKESIYMHFKHQFLTWTELNFIA